MQFSELAQQLGLSLKQKSLTLITAESCTGGMLSAAITSIPGSSAWFERGFVTYSNQSKFDLLGIDSSIIARYGAVSEQVAFQMAKGALAHSLADISISITGVAGPDGGTVDKPVGLVWFGLAQRGAGVQCFEQRFSGDRAAVRKQAVIFALELLCEKGSNF